MRIMLAILAFRHCTESLAGDGAQSSQRWGTAWALSPTPCVAHFCDRDFSLPPLAECVKSFDLAHTSDILRLVAAFFGGIACAIACPLSDSHSLLHFAVCVKSSISGRGSV
jgi:hypothetical protein